MDLIIAWIERYNSHLKTQVFKNCTGCRENLENQLAHSCLFPPSKNAKDSAFNDLSQDILTELREFIETKNTMASHIRIGKRRLYASVNEYKGMILVDLRHFEWNEQEKTLKPTKRGVALRPEEFEAFIDPSLTSRLRQRIDSLTKLLEEKEVERDFESCVNTQDDDEDNIPGPSSKDDASLVITPIPKKRKIEQEGEPGKPGIVKRKLQITVPTGILKTKNKRTVVEVSSEED